MATVDNYLALATSSWAWFRWGEISLKPTGRPVIITYSFDTQPSPDVRQLGGFTEAYWNSFRPLTESQRVAAKKALEAWSGASGIIFVEAKPGAGDIRFGVYDFNTGGPHDATKAAGYASYPGAGIGGDVFIGSTGYDSVHIFLHEIGHALGLKHPFDDDPTLVKELDNYGHTVMSYTSGGYSGNELGDLDKAAVAYLYGAAGTPYQGTWSWDAASQTLTQTNKAANAVIHGVNAANVITVGDNAAISSDGFSNLITAGDGAIILTGGRGNVIAARDKATVVFAWSSADASSAVSVLTLGNDAKVSAISYRGSLKITAGDRADILPQGPSSTVADTGASLSLTLGANAKVGGVYFGGKVEIVAGDGANITMPSTPENGVNATIKATVSVGASSTVSAYGFKNAFTITAGDGAKISLPNHSAVAANFSIKTSVTVGNNAFVWGDDFYYGLTVKAGDKASVNVALGPVEVTVGADSSVFVNPRTLVTPKADQISHFNFGVGGTFSGTNSLATTVVTSPGETNIFGGKGSEIVFIKGKSFYIDGGAGVDIAIVDGVAPTSFSKSGTYVWFDTGVVDGKTQSWRFSAVEYVEFAGALYSVAQQKYLTDFPALKTAYGALLRTSGLETTHLGVADLADRVGAGKLTAAAAVTEIAKTAGASTSVATLAYEFFTGKIPGSAGIDYLVSPTGPNPNNLNSAYYQGFNLENRYINFSVNLGKLGEGKEGFLARYGAMTLFDATREAYKTIFGAAPTDAKIHALIDTRVDYFAAYGGDGASGVGTKAAMVGWLLAEAQKADLGVMVRSNTAWLLDLSDGSAPFAIDVLDPAKGYYKADFVFGGA